VRPSFSAFQAFIAFAAGLTSVGGAVYSSLEYLRPPAVGEVVAVLQEARTEKPVRGGSLEFLTLDEAVVATLSPSDDGHTRHALKAGSYRLRVRHPRFATETRQIEVPDGGTVEVRFALAQRDESGGRSTPGGKARQLLRVLGF
jgi:hypothetical protein